MRGLVDTEQGVRTDGMYNMFRFYVFAGRSRRINRKDCFNFVFLDDVHLSVCWVTVVFHTRYKVRRLLAFLCLRTCQFVWWFCTGEWMQSGRER